MKKYLTLRQNAETEITIKKSRFICHALHVAGEDESHHFISLAKKTHRDASHTCYAYRISDAIQKASDDGEPSGTAGRPMLHVLQKNKLLYTLITITRYFGGTELGTGGLLRAYSQGASSVIEKATIVEKCIHQQLFLTFSYTHLNKIEYELHRIPCYIEPIQFQELIKYTIWVPIDSIETIKHQAATWTQGQITFGLGEIAHKESPSN